MKIYNNLKKIIPLIELKNFKKDIEERDLEMEFRVK